MIHCPQHSIGIRFRLSAEHLDLLAQSPVFPLVCRNVTPFMEAVVSSAKLYVGNLSYNTSEASVRTAFEAHGEVTSVNLITDRDSGRPKGFGFVEMGSPEEAQKAKGALDGTQLDGRAQGRRGQGAGAARASFRRLWRRLRWQPRRRLRRQSLVVFA